MEIFLIRLAPQQVISIHDPSDVAVARRAATELGRIQVLDEVKLGQLALVVTEAATNIVKYAERGEMILRGLAGGGVEILALDNGPGIADLPRQLADGNSTGGTYGIGLGAMGRLSQEFAIFSRPNQGTVLRLVLWRDACPVSPLVVGAVCLPMPGEDICGDAWILEQGPAGATLMLADGLGHGPAAAEAALAAAAVVADRECPPPAALLQQMHQALRGTRGAAVAVAQINGQQGIVKFAGVGNIAACLLRDGRRRHLVSHNGIVGSNLRKVAEFAEPWEPGCLLIAHSDGINTRWDLDVYPGLALCHPGLIAAVLYRDFRRERDDVSVVVLRQEDIFL